MKIVLTPSARQQLLDWPVTASQLPRIDANMSGGCGISVQFSLVLDEPRRNDAVIDCGDGIVLHIDRFTERYMEEEMAVDFTDDAGFIFGDSYDSSCTV
ncbi:iron-sulfur cluster biosynthesis family protein [Domibacillus tundrae]|uniref:iron-sulfur cluster biosynthesis family protein n=1 Tax=Domibacillus tundrae TaxID=1587527 RepID=UPI003390E6A5